MKKALLGFILILTAFAAHSQGDPLAIADPYVLEYGGVYYAYGTGSRNGIVVYRSKDLKNWEGPCGRTPGGLALHKEHSWGNNNFWAPEVYPTDSGFVMTYSVDTHTALAYADNPLGPFRQKEPCDVYIRDYDNIDSHIFIDDDGQAYLYWVCWYKDRGNEILAAKLSPDLQTIAGPAVECLHPRLNTWEVVPFPNGEVHRVAEGPFILKHKDIYYLTYSANHYRSQDYAVGYATSASPLGPWERHKGNPILRRPKNFVGAGHHSFFTDSSGKNYIVFHVHKDKDKVSPRRMLIAPYGFKRKKGQPDVLVIDTKNIIEPAVVPDGTCFR